MGIRMKQRRWLLLLAALVLITLAVCLNGRRTDCGQTNSQLLRVAQNTSSCDWLTKLKKENTALKEQIRQLRAQLRAPAGGNPEVLGSSRPGSCEFWCEDHEAAWPEKCHWDTLDCGACAACADWIRPAADQVTAESSTEAWSGELGTLPPIYRRMSSSMVDDFNQVCAKFREDVPYKKRMVGIAGLFNTGTNLLAETLSKNCQFQGRTHQLSAGSGPVLWQVPSGKHNHAHWQGKYFVTDLTERNWAKGYLRYEHMLSVVVVKDPFNWMSSMCRHKYAVTGGWWRHPKCPMVTSDGKVKVRWTKNNQSEFNTLLDFWNDWYREYLEVERPRIFVRYEDLLFDQETTLQSVCACAGGTLKQERVVVSGSVKAGVKGHGANDETQTTLDSALKLYSSAKQRLQRYSDDDLKFIQAHPTANSLMQKFGYFTPKFEDATIDRGDHKKIPYPGDWCKQQDPNMVWCQGMGTLKATKTPTARQEAEPCARLADIWGSVKCSQWVKVRDQLHLVAD